MIRIGKHTIGLGHPPFVIAEMSGNHNQSLERALEIVDAAAACGAHALKIQTYTPDTMTIDLNEGEFRIEDPTSLWTGRSLYDLYGEAHTPWDWHQAIFDRARQKNMIPFSTPFDHTAVEFLESLESDLYKIASFENTDLPLIKRVAETGKPVIISTGMMTLAEMEETVATVKEAGCKSLIILKCTSTYPATPEGTNLKTIPTMRDIFDCEVGLSDHTMGIGAAIASIPLGATVIEKHFTLDRSDGGVDSTFSLEPDEMASLVLESERAVKALGAVVFGPSEKEARSLQFRRSLYIVKDIKAGDQMTAANMRAIRPGHGLSPKYYDNVMGRVVKRDAKRGTAVSWDLLA